MLDFDPFGMELRAHPEQVIPMLLAHSPGFMEVEGRRSAFVATYDDVRTVTKDHASFSSVKPTDVPGMNRFDFFNGQPVMNYSDPPEHDRRRRVVNASFTRRRIEQLDVDTTAIIDGLLVGLSTSDPVDICDQVCAPMSIEVLLGAFMNVSPDDRRYLFAVLAESAALDSLAPGQPKPQAWLDAWDAGAAYCRRAIADARDSREDSLIGLIAAAAQDGGTISDDEMMAMMMVLLTGGITTMGAAAASALFFIAQQPALKARIRNDPAIATAALDEGMRLYPPVTFSMRFTTTDTAVSGTTIEAGTPVYAIWAAANHDPAEFPDPAQFDVDRPNVRSHMAFGFGVHNCIGNHITRQVGSTLVRLMVERFPEFRLAEPDVEPEFSLGSARGRHLLHVPMVLGEPAAAR